MVRFRSFFTLIELLVVIAIISDLLSTWRPEDVAHPPGWNLLYADGHAELKRDKVTYDYVISPATQTGDDWRHFEHALDTLQDL